MAAAQHRAFLGGDLEGAGAAGPRHRSPSQSHEQFLWVPPPTAPQPPAAAGVVGAAAAASRPALAIHVTRECSKKILVSLNNSDSSGVHVGRTVSRLSARAEGRELRSDASGRGEGGVCWGYSRQGAGAGPSPPSWVLGVPALPKWPAKAGEKDAIAVSGVDGRDVLHSPPQEKPPPWQSSNRHQEKHLFSCWPLAQGWRLWLLRLSRGFVPERLQRHPCQSQLVGSGEQRTGEMWPSPCTAPLHGVYSWEGSPPGMSFCGCRMLLASSVRAAGSPAGWWGSER